MTPAQKRRRQQKREAQRAAVATGIAYERVRELTHIAKHSPAVRVDDGIVVVAALRDTREQTFVRDTVTKLCYEQDASLPSRAANTQPGLNLRVPLQEPPPARARGTHSGADAFSDEDAP